MKKIYYLSVKDGEPIGGPYIDYYCGQRELVKYPSLVLNEKEVSDETYLLAQLLAVFMEDMKSVNDDIEQLQEWQNDRSYLPEQ